MYLVENACFSVAFFKPYYDEGTVVFEWFGFASCEMGFKILASALPFNAKKGENGDEIYKSSLPDLGYVFITSIHSVQVWIAKPVG